MATTRDTSRGAHNSERAVEAREEEVRVRPEPHPPGMGRAATLDACSVLTGPQQMFEIQPRASVLCWESMDPCKEQVATPLSRAHQQPNLLERGFATPRTASSSARFQASKQERRVDTPQALRTVRAVTNVNPSPRKVSGAWRAPALELLALGLSLPSDTADRKRSCTGGRNVNPPPHEAATSQTEAADPVHRACGFRGQDPSATFPG